MSGLGTAQEIADFLRDVDTADADDKATEQQGWQVKFLPFTQNGRIMTVIDVVTADSIESGDTIHFAYKGTELTVDVKTFDDTGTKIVIRGYSHETGDNVTIKLHPNQRVDILGS